MITMAIYDAIEEGILICWKDAVYGGKASDYIYYVYLLNRDTLYSIIMPLTLHGIGVTAPMRPCGQ